MNSVKISKTKRKIILEKNKLQGAPGRMDWNEN